MSTENFNFTQGWSNLNIPSKIGFDKIAVPSVVVFPWFFQIFIPKLWVVLAPLSLYILACYVFKIPLNRSLKFVRRKLFVKKVRFATIRNGSIITSLVLMVTLSLSSPVKAELEVLDSTGSSFVGSAATTGRLPSLAYQVVTGYAQLTPLSDVIASILPKTWAVRYKQPELRSIKVDFRADSTYAETVLSDLAVRYGLKISYGETSGVVLIEWGSQCVPSYDAKTKTRTLC